MSIFARNGPIGMRWFVAVLLIATVLLGALAIKTSMETQSYQRGLVEASSYNATFDYSRTQVEIERLAHTITSLAEGDGTRDQMEIAFAVLVTRLDTLPVSITGRPFRDALIARDELARTCDEIAAMLPRLADHAVARNAVEGLGALARRFSNLATVSNAVQGDIVEGWRQRLSASLDELSLNLRLLCANGLLLIVALIRQKLHFRRQALTDTLTGLPNRAAFREWTGRANGAREIAIAVIDVDLFKEINDDCGHQRGDQLLRKLGAILREAVGRRGEAARIGGDEFALMFIGDAAFERANAACSEIARTLGEAAVGCCDQPLLTLSVGLAAAQGGERELETLLLDADAAMYCAKRDGGNRLVVATQEFRNEIEHRRHVQRDIVNAVSRGEFETVFQPIVDIADLRPQGFETLLRWNHPILGRLAPDFFIPLAEENGAIIAIGRFVLDRALTIAANWPDALTVSVNVSPLQLGEKGFVADVRQALERHRVPSRRLILEITETVLIRTANASTVLDDLRALGVGIALDDFGTGYASMGYLRQYRFDRIKIDKSFISTMIEEDKSAAIVRAICGLAREISASVVAEGIETQQLLSLVAASGCESGQGYLFARPMSALQTALFIEKNGWISAAQARPALVRLAANSSSVRAIGSDHPSGPRGDRADVT